ncbi:MAG: sulfite exporter TauE/SafE family protein [Sedimentisphaerales bacterium]|nr:sulfite exporter TauE/SafE family protein [Sedimentisphaerales bacterium]
MEIILITFVVAIAGFVGTLTGFGTSTMMVPIMLSFYPFGQTLLFVGIIHMFGNIWKLLFFRKGIRCRLILSFGIPGIATAYLGARLVKLMFDKSPEILLQILGAFLICYVVYLFFKSSFKIKPGLSAGVCGGALSGFLAGFFGIGGAVRGLFLTSFDLPKAVFIATAGAIALVIDTTRLTTYVIDGVRLPHLLLWGLLLFVPVSFLGAKIAKSVVDKIPQEHFRKVVAVFLLIIGIKLLIFPK